MRHLSVVIVLSGLLLSMAHLPVTAHQHMVYPTADWRMSTPEEQGMDSAALARLLEVMVRDRVPFDSLLVIRHGNVVLDASVPPFDSRTQHAMYSVTKSVIATLVGIAIDQGLVEGVHQSIWDFFPCEATANMDERKADITVQDLLTQRSGLGFRAGHRSDHYWLGEDDQSWVQYILDRPMSAQPGTTFDYEEGNPHLLSAIIRQASGMSTQEFAQRYLFDPLGITDVIWPADPQGVQVGGSELFLSASDIARIGYLYLRNGEWEGQQILSPIWIEAATSNCVRPDLWQGYGYYWYSGQISTRMHSTRGYAAIGAGGQWLIVMPDEDIVITLTGDSDRLGLTIAGLVLDAVESDNPLPASPISHAWLQSRVDQLAHPLPAAVPLSPETARRITNQRYLLEDNNLGWQALTLQIDDASALLTLEIDGESQSLAVGLDDLHRISPVVLPGYYPFEPPFVTSVALTGSWVWDACFEIYWRDLLGAENWRVELTFYDHELRVIAMESVQGLGFRIMGTPRS